MSKSEKSVKHGVYKKEEYAAFIKLLSEDQVGHWSEIARALNVDNDTITYWRTLPEAQEAIKKGIDYALRCMQQAGARDWRMWESKLKMLGVAPPDKLEISGDSDNPIELILNKYGKGKISDIPESETVKE